jgi:hypothetical protein
MATSDSRKARKQIEKVLEREKARAQSRIEEASLQDPEWARRTEGAWKRLQVVPSPSHVKEFEDCLREKGLLSSHP